MSCQGGGGPQEAMRKLRQAERPVVARVEEDRVLLDPRTVLPEEDSLVLAGLEAAFAG